MIKVLNLYAGIGGNRKLWKNVEVTAVEYDEKIAEVYKKNFPNDIVIVADAHKYLLENFNSDWDFIWTSPPCPTHTRFNNLKFQQIDRGFKPKYPDMKLWQEIILLNNWVKCKFVVENVKLYYESFYPYYESGNHWFWSNFHISNFREEQRGIRTKTIEEKSKERDLWIPKEETKKFKDKILNNCVFPKLGLHIFNCAFKEKQKSLLYIMSI